MKIPKRVVTVLSIVLFLCTVTTVVSFAVVPDGAVAANAITDQFVEYPLDVSVYSDQSSYGATGRARIFVSISNVGDLRVSDISAIGTFQNTQPVGKDNTLTIDGVSIAPDEEYSFDYSVSLQPAKLGFFQRLILQFKQLFWGTQSAPRNRFDDGRNMISKEITLRFGSNTVKETVFVYYAYDTEIINASTQEAFSDAVSVLTNATLNDQSFDAAAAKADDYYASRLIVKYSDLAKADFKDVDADKIVLGNFDDVAVLQFSNRNLAQSSVAALNKDDGVQYVEPDTLISIDSDPVMPAAVNASPGEEIHSWGRAQTGADHYANYLEKNDRFGMVKVAVVDTGVDTDHSFLAGRLLANGYDFIHTAVGAEDDNGHGTHVAGIIADCTAGLNVKIMPVKVLDKSGRSYLLSVVCGVEYAANSGADIINLSLGGGHSDYLHEAVEKAIAKGSVVCVAAGNENQDTSAVCPADVADAIVVAAIDQDSKRADFSNFGATVDVAAPGVRILSSYLGGEYKELSGTSMATPHVSAAAAMLLLEHPDLSPHEVEEKIVSACRDLGAAGKDNYYGFGRIDLNQLIPSVTLRFVTNGGSSIASKTVKSGDFVDLETPSKSFTVSLNANGGTVGTASYTRSAELEGWYTDPQFRGERIVKGGSYLVTKDATLYAKWIDPALGAINAPNAREGYTFIGWFSGTTGYSSTSIVSRNLQLEAQWQRSVIQLNFNGNGGTCSESSRTVAFGDVYGELPTPTRENARFAGWYTDQKGGTEVSSSTVMTEGSGSVDLYAHWLIKKTGTITTSAKNADGQQLSVSWKSYGYLYSGAGNAVACSGTGTSFKSDQSPTQGTFSSQTGLSSGGAVFEISNIAAIRSYIKGLGGELTKVSVSAVREDNNHGNSSGTHGYMYAVSNRASSYSYGNKPSGTQFATSTNWTRGGKFTGSTTSTAILNNLMGTGSADYRSIMFHAGSAAADYVKISSITVTFTYTYYAAE